MPPKSLVTNVESISPSTTGVGDGVTIGVGVGVGDGPVSEMVKFVSEISK